MSNKAFIYNYLTEAAALSRAVAIGIMANIQRESNYSPTAKGDSGTSYGLCQWHKSRWDRLKTFASNRGLNVAAVETQLLFLLDEFQKYYKTAWDNMNAQPNTADGAAEVAYIMCVKYEIPANKEQSGLARANLARSLWSEYSTTDSGNVDNSTASSTASAGRYATYTIKKGDTLTKISYSFRCTVAELLSVNAKITNPDVIIIGDSIKIPGR